MFYGYFIGFDDVFFFLVVEFVIVNVVFIVSINFLYVFFNLFEGIDVVFKEYLVILVYL